MKMPSFDIVSEVDKQEVDNAVNQVMKEVAQRYDFKGSKTQVTLEKDLIKILSDDDYKMKTVQEILMSKAFKRGIDIKSLEFGKVEAAGGQMLRCEVKIIQGIDSEKAKKIVAAIKDSKIKVQAQIQDNQVRVTGKKRDDLQEVIALAKGKDFGLALQFKNFRD
jgi:cyclic-di-GMP-binding protein